MSYTADIVEGLAELLDEQGLGTYGPPDEPYPTEGTAIVLGVMPALPDRVLCLTPYPVEDTGGPEAITAVQVRIRAGRDPRAVYTLADDVFRVLHGREHFRLRTVPVALMWRASEAPLGLDANGRMELTANYYAHTHRATPHAYE
ncbi:minor capsid protein [Streptomyces sp. TRM75563]|uniref:minor capsid protein n=1 Tax=Streptomyces sp. TRM75563 TaxID=2817418 RepID=UPI001F615B0B|nr:minor capsid protein [Streptomyces sp. TRM75563]MCI4045478.1 minor capsid protein [Streptomyces sp. TRM75563]